MKKHAIDVDKDSRRVIILTPNKEDHSWEDQKYFLVLNPNDGKNNNFLKESLKILRSFFEETRRGDYLHDELAQFKIDISESDYSDYAEY